MAAWAWRGTRSVASIAALFVMQAAMVDPAKAQPSSACQPLTAAQAADLAKNRDAIGLATDKLTGRKNRDGVRALLVPALALLDEGCLDEAGRAFSAIRALDLGKDEGAIGLWRAAIDVEANIAIARNDLDGAATIWLGAADELPARGAATVAISYPLVFQAAETWRRAGEERGDAAALEQAAVLYRDRLLPMLNRENDRLPWLFVQTNLGIALYGIGQHRSGAARNGALEAAVGALEQALAVARAEENPWIWAKGQQNLAAALTSLASGGSGDVPDYARRAVDAGRLALAYLSPASGPDEWAGAKANLASGLMMLGKYAADSQSDSLLEEAAAAIDDSLTVYTADKTPSLWAAAQANLGLVRLEQAQRKNGPVRQQLLQEALAAFDASQTALSQIDGPRQWATGALNRGWTLWLLATNATGRDAQSLMTRAIEADRDALTIFTREETPVQWAQTRNNLGLALGDLGNMRGGEAGLLLLREAIVALEGAMTVFTRSDMPLQWAQARANAGAAMANMSRLEPAREKEHLTGAAQALAEAATVFTQQGVPAEAQRANAMVAQIRQMLARMK